MRTIKRHFEAFFLTRWEQTVSVYHRVLFITCDLLHYKLGSTWDLVYTSRVPLFVFLSMRSYFSFPNTRGGHRKGRMGGERETFVCRDQCSPGWAVAIWGDGETGMAASLGTYQDRVRDLLGRLHRCWGFLQCTVVKNTWYRPPRGTMEVLKFCANLIISMNWRYCHCLTQPTF